MSATPPKVSLRKVRAATEANIQNEQVTRQRVDHLESFAGAIAASVEQAQNQIDATTHIVGQHMDFLQMNFFERVWWFVSGEFPKRERPSTSPVTESSEVA